MGTEPTGINGRGQMVGTYAGADGIGHGFLWDNGAFTTIDAPGATVATLPFGINNHGQIVGASFDAKQRRGFMLSNGTFTTHSAPGAVLESFPLDIDDRGRIIGIYF